MSDAKEKLERELTAEKEKRDRGELRTALYASNGKLRLAIPGEAYLLHLLKEVERHFEMWFTNTEPVAEPEPEAIDLDDTDEIEKREQAADDAAAVESEKAAAAKDARRRAPSGLR